MLCVSHYAAVASFNILKVRMGVSAVVSWLQSSSKAEEVAVHALCFWADRQMVLNSNQTEFLLAGLLSDSLWPQLYVAATKERFL